jgi:vancomycin resistance protein YoaR
MRPPARESFSRMPRRRIRRSPGDFAAILTGLLLLSLVGFALWWQVWHVNRIYTGVSVAGVSIGGVSRSAALERLEDALLRHPLPPISVQYGSQQWPITADHVRARADLVGAVNQAYLVGRQGASGARIGAQFDALLGGVDITPAYDIDPSHLRHVVNQIAAEVRRAPRAEARIGDTVVAAEPGLDVDVEMTVQTLLAQLRDGANGGAVHTPLHVVTIAPATGETDAAAAGSPERTETTQLAGHAAAPSLTPLLLRDAAYGLEFGLDPATIRGLLLSENPLAVDENKVRDLLIQWSEQINISPRDARLRFDRSTNSPVVLQTSRPGRQLDVEMTVSAIQVAITTGSDSAPLTIRSVPPAVDSNRIAEMGIRELVGSGTTYFAGSSAARVRNIVISAEKFDGVVIPPNGIFSFNHYVEDVSAANGFEDSLVIWGDRTAVGIGGGICQVSTTVFRAAFLSGMPIVERYNHGYVVDWYGEPGLDATIYTPTVDFRFRNDTGAYLLIEPVVDTANGVHTFNFYGTKPDRTVTVGNPIITDVEPAPPPLFTVDHSLAPGQREQVDWAKQGMTVRIDRTITENGVSRTESLISRYQPWRAIYLVGPDADIPETTGEETALLRD